VSALLLGILLLAQVAEEVDFGTTTAERLRLLRDPRPRVRMRAAMLLAGAKPDEALAALLVALHDMDAGVRLQAARTLSRYRDERAIPFLVRRAQEERSVRVLVALLYATGECGGPYAGRSVVRFLEHPSQEVRAAAAAALGRVGDAGQRDLLWAALRYEPDDPGFLVRSAVLAAFTGLGWTEDAEKAIAELEAQGAHQHWRSRTAIVAAAGDARLASRAAWVEEIFAKDEDPRVVAAAAASLAKLDRLDSVARGLGHGSPVVRRASMAALEEAGDARGLRGAKTLVREDPDVEVRFEAALLLSRANDPDADIYLVDALRAQNPLFWITALSELERRHGRSFGRDAAKWEEWLRGRRAPPAPRTGGGGG
jgi:HEAT repeat protein